MLASLSLGLPRVTGGPCSVQDVLVELVAWSAVIVLLTVCSSHPRPRLERALSAAMASAFFGLTTAMTLATHRDPSFRIAGLGVALPIAVMVVRVREPRGLAAVLVAGALLSVITVWALTAGELAWPLLGLLFVWGLATASSAGTRVAWATPLGAAVLALTPGQVLPHVAWDDTRAPGTGPDIVLVIADTLRHDTSTRLPLMRELAAGGSDWGPAQSSSTWTLPSVTSVMTGTDVTRHGAHAEPNARVALEATPGMLVTHRAIRDDVPTLAELLAAHGYDTAAVLAANPFVSARFGLSRGFDVFDWDGRHAFRFHVPRSRGGAARPMVTQLLVTALPSIPSPALHAFLGVPVQLGDAMVVRRARELIAARRHGHPLMLWVHLMGMHKPNRHAIEIERIARTRRLELATEASRFHYLAHSPFWSSPEGIDQLRQAYEHEASYLEQNVRRLLAAFESAEERGRLVVFTADHGEELFEHGRYEHGHAYFQEVTAVPLVLSGPSMPRPDAGHGPASLIDVAPTILGAAGIQPPSTMTGLDLARARPEQTRARTLVARDLLYADDTGARRAADTCAARHADLKAIRMRADELYDLARDPGEVDDLAPARPGDTARLLTPCAGTVQTGEVPAVDAADVEALRALGYVR